MRKKIWLVLGSALALRLISLNQSLWLDEAITARVVRQYGLGEIVKMFSVVDFHPPLYYWILKLWTGVFGLGEISLRMPSVVFGVITVWLVYQLGKEIKNEKTGLGAGILTAVNPLLIYYSQEARMYSLAVMWLTAAVLYFFKIEKKESRSNIVLFNLFGFLALVSFYGSIFLIVTMLAWWLVKKKWQLLTKTGWGLAIAMGAMGPLLIKQWQNSQLLLGEVTGWKNVLGKSSLKNLILIPVKFGSGRISFYPKKIYYLMAGTWTTGILLNLKKNIKLGFLLLMPLILAGIVSFKVPMMQYFRFLYLVPIMCLVIKPKKVLVVGFLFWSLAYLLIPQFHRENWKGLAESLGEEVWMVTTVSDPVTYYRPEMVVRDLKQEEPEAETIEVIPYAVEIHGLDYKKKLAELGYERREEKTFREVVVEKWRRVVPR